MVDDKLGVTKQIIVNNTKSLNIAFEKENVNTLKNCWGINKY